MISYFIQMNGIFTIIYSFKFKSFILFLYFFLIPIKNLMTFFLITLFSFIKFLIHFIPMISMILKH